MVRGARWEGKVRGCCAKLSRPSTEATRPTRKPPAYAAHGPKQCRDAHERTPAHSVESAFLPSNARLSFSFSARTPPHVDACESARGREAQGPVGACACGRVG